MENGRLTHDFFQPIGAKLLNYTAQQFAQKLHWIQKKKMYTTENIIIKTNYRICAKGVQSQIVNYF